MCRLCEILEKSPENLKLLKEETKYNIYEEESGDLILIYKLHEIFPSGQETQRMGQELFKLKNYKISNWYTDYAKTLGDKHFHFFLRETR